MRRFFAALTLIGTLASVGVAEAQDGVIYRRVGDVVYGRKHGMALTLDVFAPKAKANGLGLVFVVSGGWFSAHDTIPVAFLEPLVDRGYTVFAVMHRSQPKFTIPDAIEDVNRSVRFVRFHAKDYKIDPDHLGIFGISAGGHLSLMQATNGDEGKISLLDPVERVSSRVQAVAAFFPPTDFLNYGVPGVDAIGRNNLWEFRPAFDFTHFDPKVGLFVPIRDEAKRAEIARGISPINHVSKDDPPTLILQGDADTLVPRQQADTMLAKLKAEGVETKLIVKPGGAHGWPNMHEDFEHVADWFDAHLKAPH